MGARLDEPPRNSEIFCDSRLNSRKVLPGRNLCRSACCSNAPGLLQNESERPILRPDFVRRRRKVSSPTQEIIAAP